MWNANYIRWTATNTLKKNYFQFFLVFLLADGRRDNSEMTLRESRIFVVENSTNPFPKVNTTLSRPHLSMFMFIVLLIFWLMCNCRWLLASDRLSYGITWLYRTIDFGLLYIRAEICICTRSYWNRFCFLCSFIYAYVIVLCKVAQECVCVCECSSI